MRISILAMIVFLLTTSIGISLILANAQPTSSNKIPLTSRTHPLTTLLIHGYFEDSAVWHKWEQMLNKDHIPYVKVFFGFSQGSYYDECGSASFHADDLNTIIQKVKAKTGQNQVNMVAHSKGGLDARVYLANSRTHDVANLIMIGTPNAGSRLAYSNSLCAPAVYDIRPGASDTKVVENTNTKYYTIAGDWNPSLASTCPPVENFFGINWPKFEREGYSKLQKPNDGIVPVSSVESLPHYTSLGHSADCHTNLLSNKEYELAKPILSGSMP